MSEPSRTLREIPAIVFDEPEPAGKRLLAGVVLGLLLGALAGVGLALLGDLSGDETLALRPRHESFGPSAADSPAGARDAVVAAAPAIDRAVPPWVLPGALVGFVVGLAIGWAWKRPSTPRRGTIQLELPRRPVRRDRGVEALARRSDFD